MEFTTLPKTLGDFFDSLLPALTQMTILIAFVLFLVGLAPLASYLRARLARFTEPTKLAINPYIKESGVLKLVPIGVFVGFLLLGIVIDRAVSFIEFKIPGQLGYAEPDVLVSAVPNEHLTKLWALFPAAEDEYMLDLVLEYQVESARAAVNAERQFPWEHHDDKFAVGARTINSVKFYVVLGLVICLFSGRLGIARRRVWLRYGMIVVAAATLTLFIVGQQIEAKKQSDWAKVAYVVAKQVAGGKEWEARLADKAVQEKFAQRLDQFRDSHRQSKISAFYARP